MKRSGREPNALTDPVDIGDRLEVKIDEVKQNGEAIAHIDGGFYPIFIKPRKSKKFEVGEIVKVSIFQLDDGWAVATIAPGFK